MPFGHCTCEIVLKLVAGMNRAFTGDVFSKARKRQLCMTIVQLPWREMFCGLLCYRRLLYKGWLNMRSLASTSKDTSTCFDAPSHRHGDGLAPGRARSAKALLASIHSRLVMTESSHSLGIRPIQ
jgi:hypothetical protein